jgi:hypothetical protein
MEDGKFMDAPEIVASNNMIDDLRSAITDSTAGLFDVPLLIKQVIENEVWRERFVLQTKEKTYFTSFEEFVKSSPPEGLGTTIGQLQRLCADNLAVIDLLDRARSKSQRGGDRRSDNFKCNNVTFEKRKSGNSAIYSLRRLRKERPDLHKKVLSKEISINQAMIEAGLRKKMMTIAADISKICTAIKLNFTSVEIAELIERLKSKE